MVDEKSYEMGSRAAWQSMLRLCLRELGYSDKPDAAAFAQMVEEREAAIAALRSICEDYGDNNWSNDLHLADILNKRLLTRL
jgi:hypothetical protein